MGGGCFDVGFPSLRKEYPLRPRVKKKNYFYSQGGLSLDLIHPNLISRKFHLLKAQHKYFLDIKKGNNSNLIKALEVEKTL
jgi:hypothetical protein